jgi:predicted TIM-barrel fold metal-dependent hydrolase
MLLAACRTLVVVRESTDRGKVKDLLHRLPTLDDIRRKKFQSERTRKMKMNRRKFLESSSMLLSAGALGAAAGAAAQAQKPRKKYRLIATEEAFASPGQVEAMRHAGATLWNDPDMRMWRGFLENETILRRLLDLEQERLGIMDQFGVDMHLLSLTAPGVQLFDAGSATALAVSANDLLAETVKKHPTRYTGLASFAPQDPKGAAKEIERAIKTLKLNGLIVNSHTNGEYYDDPKFWPIFEAATALDAAIYIHPRNLPAHADDILQGAINLDGAIWGFQMETGLHAMRLIVGGVFDQFPKLKIVLGHMGEAVPYWLYRIDYMYNVYTSRNPGRIKIKRKPSEYVKDNFLITTSGVNFHPTLKYCHEVLGPDNIMFAIDYPYQDTEGAVTFMNSAPLSEADLEKITHGNAERIFHIPPA